MPLLPERDTADTSHRPIPEAGADDASPYLRIAADLQAAITCGALPVGSELPTLVELASRYEVAESTAHRAIHLLHEAGAISVARGRRARVQLGGHLDARGVLRFGGLVGLVVGSEWEFSRLGGTASGCRGGVARTAELRPRGGGEPAPTCRRAF